MTMDVRNLRIVMLMFQPSIVARGLEKKLTDLGNFVTNLVNDFKDIDSYFEFTDLFIFHLPAKVADDSKEVNVLVQLCDKLKDNDQKMIIVGDPEGWEDLGKVYTAITSYVWIFRPVEIKDLTVAIEKAMAGVRPPGAQCRILIVDDDPDYAKIVKEWIKDVFKVDIVTAGVQAINFLMKLPPNDQVDLILLDYEMPVVDGPQVLQMLRSDEVTEKIPVVFLTGVGDRESVTRVMSLKPDGYLLKSTSKDGLLKFLKSKLSIPDD